MDQINLFELTKPTFKFDATKAPIRIFESFAGIGCQRMAMNRIVAPYISVGVSEIDRFALASYMAIHNDCNNYGDICKMKEIPPCDIFTYSFPCTDLSKAGKQAGMGEGTRSGLVYEVLRLLKATADKPKVLIMENVVDLVQVNFIRQFNAIQSEIEQMGYTNYTQVMNAKEYGVAQNRERVFMVSILGDYYYGFPKPFHLQKRLKDYLETEVADKYYLSERLLKFFQENHERNAEKGNGFTFDPQTGDKPARGITTLAGHRMDDNYINVVGLATPDSQAGKVYGPGGHAPALCAGNHGYAMGYVKEQDEVSVEPITEDYGMLHGGKWDKMHDIGRRVYNTGGEAPTIHTMGGGNLEPKIMTEGKVSSSKDAVIVNPEGIAKTHTAGHNNTPKILVSGSTQKNASHSTGDDPSPTLNAAMGMGGGQTPIIMVAEATKNGHSAAGEGDSINLSQPNSKTRRGRVGKGVLTGDKKNCVAEPQLRIRKLTPRECWRLMGIDDVDFDKACKVVSDSQLYKQAGNGIVVDVFAAILDRLIDR